VYRFLVAEAGSTREAAVRFGISQTRVRQISRQVALWAAEALPPGTEAETAGLLRVAEATASDRLQHFYEQTMAQWRETHQPKFLGLAMRVTLADARLPARAFAIDAAVADAWDAEGGEGTGNRGQESGAGSREPAVEEPRAVPLDGDCSSDRDLRAEASSSSAASLAVSREAPGKLALLLGDEEHDLREQIARARTLLTPPDPQALPGLSALPDSDEFSVDAILRQQARKKRKAK
jgi:hypothetical protein